MPGGAAADVVFANVVDLQRGHHPCVHIERFERVLQRQCIHDGGEHAHVIAGHAIHAGTGKAGAAEDVAAADDNGDLDTAFPRRRDFTGDALDGPGLDPVIQFAHQRLTAQFQQYATVWKLGVTHVQAFSSLFPGPLPGGR